MPFGRVALNRFHLSVRAWTRISWYEHGDEDAFEASDRPDPNSDRADERWIGTAYRIPGESSHASQPSSETPTKRRMRRMKQDP